MKILTIISLATVSILLGCGGGNEPDPEPQTTEYQQLLRLANLKQAEASLLASKEPCSEAAQCSSLVLSDNFKPCSTSTTIDYSLASPTASAASAAAAEYNSLTLRASTIAPSNNSIASCTTTGDFTPLNCIQNKCTRGFIISAP